MAAEYENERSDDAPVTSDTQPAVKIDIASDNVDNVDPGASPVAGDPATPADAPESPDSPDAFAKPALVSDSGAEDLLGTSADLPNGGGSDSEASRTGAPSGQCKQLETDDDSRTNGGRAAAGVKKPPASFKSISVNKSFMTAKASSGSTTPKSAGDKPATSAAGLSPGVGSMASVRPRLVAKAVSGSVSKSSAVNGTKAGSSSAVWNKNQPPQPKKYTDEELKKYGIHMASRLQPDEAKGGATWADEDEDEDWAPEAITWKDGTKIEIEDHVAAPLPPPPSAPPAAPAAPTASPAPPPPLAPLTVRDSSGSDKAGSPAQASPSIKPGVLASGKGLVLKGQPEKPTLVAKPPAPPTPAKSPWATLPKVDKVSPVFPDLANSAPRLPPKDGFPPKLPSSLPPPPKEIAADDFSRGPWRGAPGAPSRELFDSRSGRYEPVSDPRRMAPRADSHPSKQPASVLQRSAHHDQQGPAEPSPAFQTHRATEQHGPFARRRGSSNVSGVSSGFMHNRPYPADVTYARRESFTAITDSPVSPRNFSPVGHSAGPVPPPGGPAWQPRASPAATYSQPQPHDARTPLPPLAATQPSPAPMAPPQLDPDMQKKLMREKREEAMRRRKEEEEREEAAKRERIQKKLEALGPAPEPKSAKKINAQSQSPVAPPVQIQPREEAAQASKAPGPDVSVKPPSAEASQKLATISPDQNMPPQAANPTEPAILPQANNHPHTWSAAAPKQSDRYPASSPWVSSGKNLWASPHNDRSLGNGTFNADLGTAQLARGLTKTGPGPIAPPSSARGAMASQNSLAPGVPARQPPIGPPKPATRAEPAAVEKPASSQSVEKSRNDWVNAVRQKEDAMTAIINERFEKRDQQLREEGRTLVDIQPTIQDTWRPTRLNQNGERVKSSTKETVQRASGQEWPVASETKAAAETEAPKQMLGSNAAVPQQGRSRFFPPSDVRVALAQSADSAQVPLSVSPSPPPPESTEHPVFDSDAARPRVTLPPSRPVVKLPPTPTAEPTPSASSAPAASGPPSFAWARSAPYKESVPGPNAAAGQVEPPRSSHDTNNTWQAKIDNLLSRGKASSPQKPSLEPAPAHPRGMPAPQQRRPQAYEQAQRSGPPAPAPLPASQIDVSFTTKEMAEECFAEQEMGSLPLVRLPTETPDAAWQPPCPPPTALPKKMHPVVASADPFHFLIEMGGAGRVWRISIPGRPPRTLTVPFGRSMSNNRRGGAGQRGGGSGRHVSGGSNPSSHGHGGRGAMGRGGGRDQLALYGGGGGGSDPGSASGGPLGPSGSNSSGHHSGHQQHRNGRGNGNGGGGGGTYRARENWSRNPPAAIQT